MNGWMDGQMDGRMNRQMDGQTTGKHNDSWPPFSVDGGIMTFMSTHKLV